MLLCMELLKSIVFCVMMLIFECSEVSVSLCRFFLLSRMWLEFGLKKCGSRLVIVDLFELEGLMSVMVLLVCSLKLKFLRIVLLL